MAIENIKESECGFMKRFNFWLRLKFFDRIKLLAKFNRCSVTEMMIELLEIGYIHKLGRTKKVD